MVTEELRLARAAAKTMKIDSAEAAVLEELAAAASSAPEAENVAEQRAHRAP
jgi:hypothetical protein